MTEKSRVNWKSLPCNERVTKSGTTVLKLKAKVPTIAMTTTTMRSSGMPRT